MERLVLVILSVEKVDHLIKRACLETVCFHAGVGLGEQTGQKLAGVVEAGSLGLVDLDEALFRLILPHPRAAILAAAQK